MSRYIDVVFAKAEFTGNFQNFYTPGEIKAILDEVPIADVVEAKHGEWIELPNGWDGIDEYLRFECSECHREVFNNFPFCPYCRADMRGET